MNRPIESNDQTVIQRLDQKYVDPDGRLALFAQWIANCSLSTSYYSGTVQEYYSPYLVLLQCSGSGKTKLMFEIGSQYYFTFFVCLEQRASWTPPAVIQLLKSMEYIGFDAYGSWAQTNELEAKRKAFAFFQACAKYLYLFLDTKINAGISINAKKPSPDLLGEFLSAFKPSTSSDRRSGWDSILQSMDEFILAFTTELSLPEELDYIKKLMKLGIKKVVFAFDEASVLTRTGPLDTLGNSMVSSFQCIRSVARDIAKNYAEHGDSLICLVMADTNSRVSNFAASRKDFGTYSMRHILQSHELFPPFFLISGHDVNAREYFDRVQSLITGADSRTCWKSVMDWRDAIPGFFATVGSPLWSVFMKWNEEKVPQVGDLITYALHKLKSGNLIGSSNAMLASLVSRCALTVLPDSRQSTDLVAGSMAHLNYLSQDRSRAFIGYPADPVLAAGGALMIKNADPTNHPVNVLSNMIEHTIVEVGEVAEAVMRMNLLSAFDAATFQRTPIKWLHTVLFSDWMKSLFTPLVFEKLEASFKKYPIWNGRVFVNHFIKTNSRLEPEHISYALLHGCGLSGYSVQTGFDMLVPVVLPDGQLSAAFFQSKSFTELLYGTAVGEAFKKTMREALRLFQPDGYAKLPLADVTSDPNFATMARNENSLHFLVNLCQGEMIGEPQGPSVLPKGGRLNVNHLPGFVELQGDFTIFFNPIWPNERCKSDDITLITRKILKPRVNYINLMKAERHPDFSREYLRGSHLKPVLPFCTIYPDKSLDASLPQRRPGCDIPPSLVFIPEFHRPRITKKGVSLEPKLWEKMAFSWIVPDKFGRHPALNELNGHDLTGIMKERYELISDIGKEYVRLGDLEFRKIYNEYLQADVPEKLREAIHRCK